MTARALPSLFAAAVLACAAPAVALPLDRLAVLVGDRIAGPAETCLDRLDIDQVHLVAGGFVFVPRTGGAVYLNLPATGGGFVHDGVVPLIDPAWPRLCRGERVRLLGPSRAPLATVRLGPFIPFRRP